MGEITIIKCPVCNADCMNGESYCKHCGAQLVRKEKKSALIVVCCILAALLIAAVIYCGIVTNKNEAISSENGLLKTQLDSLKPQVDELSQETANIKEEVNSKNVVYKTEIVHIPDFNGQKSVSVSVDKSKNITLSKTSFSEGKNNYESLALPELKLGNIIGHPTLGWDDEDYYIPDIVPEVFDGMWTLNDVFYDGDYPVAIYGRTPSDVIVYGNTSEKDISRRGRNPHLIMLVDPHKEIKRVYDVSTMTTNPQKSDVEDDYEVVWAVVKDGILYFSIAGLSYSKSEKSSYIVAIDTYTDQIIWKSNPHTCNSRNFVIIDNSLVCGFGFSGIPDYVNVFNRFTGVQSQHIWVSTAPDWFAYGSDGNLYVTLYDEHISFTVKR